MRAILLITTEIFLRKNECIWKKTIDSRPTKNMWTAESNQFPHIFPTEHGYSARILNFTIKIKLKKRNIALVYEILQKVIKCKRALFLGVTRV